MNEASTRARLVTFGDPGSEPVLGEADIQVLLDMARRSDKNGLWPTDTGWEESYDANYAIAQCWLLKATRLAPRYLFMSGGKMFSRNQFYEHCMELHKRFLAKADLQVLALGTETSRISDIPVANNWNSPHVNPYD